MERLRKRSEFLAVAKGRRVNRAAFTIQAMARPQEDGAQFSADEQRGPPRFGFTVTKKLGNSPARNRIRRRLREAVRLSPAVDDLANLDLVLVARPEARTQAFDDLVADVTAGLLEIARRGVGARNPQPARAQQGRTPAAPRMATPDTGRDPPLGTD